MKPFVRLAVLVTLLSGCPGPMPEPMADGGPLRDGGTDATTPRIDAATDAGATDAGADVGSLWALSWVLRTPCDRRSP